MEFKSNQFLIGIILLSFGVITLLKNLFHINYLPISLLIVGFSFLMLYITKKKSWSLIIGVYSLCFGIANLLGTFGITSINDSLGIIVFFGVPGIIFLVLFLDKNKRGLLMPSSIFIWMTIYIITSKFYINSNSSLFFLCMSMAFLMAYFLGKDFLGKWTFYISMFLFIMSVYISMKGKFILNPWLSPTLIIIIGLILITKKNKLQ